MKNTKSALITSVIALLLCFAMLFGTTFAWFTDEVVNSNNIIKTGKLEVTMEHSADKATWIDSSTASPAFSYNNWEPGYTDVKFVKLTNIGTLAFKYQLNIVPTSSPAAEKFNLADVIDVYFGIDDGSLAVPTKDNRDAVIDSLDKVGTLAELIADADGAARGIILPKAQAGVTTTKLTEADEKIAVNETVSVCIALKMQETAGNDYQNLMIGLAADEVTDPEDTYGFALQLLATQYTYENDSFDNMYDEKAPIANCHASTADELIELLEKGEQGTVIGFTSDIKIDPAGMSNAYGTTGINVKNGETIDGNGYTLDIKGAGGTWDSGINTTGGTIKDLTVTGSFRGIFINHNSTHSEPVILDNVTIDGTTYTISCDQGMKQTLTATDSTFNGWTSYAATLGSAKFINCTFGEGNGYAFCRPYAPTEFVGCEFEKDYTVDPRAAVTFENCTLDGVALTAANLADLVTDTAKATVK